METINMYQEIRDRLDKIMEATEVLYKPGKMMDNFIDPEIMCMLTPLDYSLYIIGYIRNKVTCIQSIVDQMEFDAAGPDQYKHEVDDNRGISIEDFEEAMKILQEDE